MLYGGFPMSETFIPKLVKYYNYTPDVKEIIEIDSTGFGRSGGRQGKKSSEVSQEDRKRNLQRVKRNCRRLAFANDLGQVHMVLTYKENMQDVDKADLDFKEFMKALHKIYPHVKYLATREFQQRGSIHYHVLLNQRLDVKKVQKLWKQGFVFLKAHSNKMKAVMYVLKYISKEVGENVLTTKNGHTKKAYLSSKGLKKQVDSCVLRFCINTPDEYVEYNDSVNFMMTNLTEGWDLPFELEIDDKRKIKGRSILMCAADNY